MICGACGCRVLNHAYRPSTKANSGRCLSLGCECPAVIDPREGAA